MASSYRSSILPKSIYYIQSFQPIFFLASTAASSTSALRRQQQLYVPRHRRAVLARLDVEVAPGKTEALTVHEGDDVAAVVKMFTARFHMKEDYVQPLIEMASKVQGKEG